MLYGRILQLIMPSLRRSAFVPRGTKRKWKQLCVSAGAIYFLSQAWACRTDTYSKMFRQGHYFSLLPVIPIPASDISSN
jgi:hypothetical protein